MSCGNGCGCCPKCGCRATCTCNQSLGFDETMGGFSYNVMFSTSNSKCGASGGRFAGPSATNDFSAGFFSEAAAYAAFYG